MKNLSSEKANEVKYCTTPSTSLCDMCFMESNHIEQITEQVERDYSIFKVAFLAGYDLGLEEGILSSID